MTSEAKFQNLASAIPGFAEQFPDKDAVCFPKSKNSDGTFDYVTISYREFVDMMDAYAAGFRAIGIEKGMRVSFMVRPSIEFLPLVFALFKIGAVPVLIDPGMGMKNLFRCIEQVKPDVFVGIPIVHVIRQFFRKSFRSVRIFVTIGKRLFWGGYDLKDITKPEGDSDFAEISATDEAAIIFTTGSTGPPKGVIYNHGMFVAQRDSLRDTFQLTSDDIDMPGFALFAMFTISMGMTIVIPDMDPTRPAQVDPTNIIEAINGKNVTYSFGSPALWNRVSIYCDEKNITLPSLRNVLMAGAPIPYYLHKRMLGNILSDGCDIHTPYGATESLPITTFTGSQVLSETFERTGNGNGVCVGNPMSNVTIKIIKTSDKPVPSFNDIDEMPQGEKGEIIVKGPVVSPAYFNRDDQTELHKIYETESRTENFWHRIGDIGYYDDKGRVWFCGRKNHRVETGDATHYSVCCEGIFNTHERVFRSALVGLGNDRYRQTPAIIIEAEQGHHPQLREQEEQFRKELLEIGRANSVTESIDIVLFHPSFPVDIRHNAKIFREKLTVWANDEVKN